MSSPNTADYPLPLRHLLSSHTKDNITRQCLLRGEDVQIASFVALAAMGEMQGAWQPIETAPKDGSDILVFIPTSPSYAKVKAGFFRKSHGHFGFYGSHTLRGERDHPPTHWMPLPNPPVSVTNGGSSASTPEGERP